MTKTAYTAAEYIAEQSDRIQRLISEIHQLRQQNATLTAQLVKLPTTDVTPEQLAQVIIANCPRWRAVGLALVFHAMEESNAS
jgi:hypothetical protein